jgi:hypothetical protein
MAYARMANAGTTANNTFGCRALTGMACNVLRTTYKLYRHTDGYAIGNGGNIIDRNRRKDSVQNFVLPTLPENVVVL